MNRIQNIRQCKRCMEWVEVEQEPYCHRCIKELAELHGAITNPRPGMYTTYAPLARRPTSTGPWLSEFMDILNLLD